MNIFRKFDEPFDNGNGKTITVNIFRTIALAPIYLGMCFGNGIKSAVLWKKGKITENEWTEEAKKYSDDMFEVIMAVK